MTYRVKGEKRTFHVETKVSMLSIDVWLPCDNKGNPTFSDKKKVVYRTPESAIEQMNVFAELQK